MKIVGERFCNGWVSKSGIFHSCGNKFIITTQTQHNKKMCSWCRRAKKRSDIRYSDKMLYKKIKLKKEII